MGMEGDPAASAQTFGKTIGPASLAERAARGAALASPACGIREGGREKARRMPCRAETKKGPEGPSFSIPAEARILFGAGNESCTRALSLCFPITFSTVVISEELNYSLVFRPRQQSSSNHFHQRPRMIHPPVVTPDASSC